MMMRWKAEDLDWHAKLTSEFCLQKRENELDKLISFSKAGQFISPKRTYFFKRQSNQIEYKEIIDELPFLTFSEYMEFAMFEPEQGYYSSGKVNFGRDFGTNATKNRGLAFLNLLDMLRQWLDSGQPEKFNNYEGGAGDGKLAFDTLSFAEELAQSNLQNGEFDLTWSRFYNALHYTIVELSPALIERQSKLCQKYIDAKKLEILNASVVEFLPDVKIHRYCSNELLDDLPQEGFTKDQNGNILTQTKLQTISKKTFLKYPEINIYKSEITEMDQHYRRILQSITDISKIPSDVYVVNRNFFSQMPVKLKSLCKYCDIYLPFQYFDKSHTVLKNNMYILRDIEPGKVTYVSSHLNEFAKAIESADRVLFFDYGGVDDKEISSPVRYYKNEPDVELHNFLFNLSFSRNLKYHFQVSPLTEPKKTFVNITHDVDFHAVLRTFGAVGFKVKLYGHQSIILSELDEKLLEQALLMITKKFKEDNALPNSPQHFTSALPLMHDLKNFAYESSNFRFIMLERQTTLAEDYYSLPDIKLNYDLCQSFEKNLLEQQRREIIRLKKNHDNTFSMLLKKPPFYNENFSKKQHLELKEIENDNQYFNLK